MSSYFKAQRTLTFRLISNEIRDFGSQRVAKSIASSSTLDSIDIVGPLDSPDEKVVRMIYNTIARNPNIHEVYFGTNQVTLKQIRCLCSRIRMRHLRKLTFSACNTDGVVSADIAAILRSNRQLEELLVENISDGDMVVEGIAIALRFRSSLKVLELTNTNLTVTGVLAIGRLLQQSLSLTILDIKQNDLELDIDAAAALTDGIKRSPLLKELLFSVASISMAAGCLILDALSQKRNVTKVELMGIQLGHDGSLSVARLIEGGGAIESLSLNHKGIGGVGEPSQTTLYLTPIVRALAFNHTLKIMYLGKMRLRMDGMQSICSTSLCNSSLEILGLEECRFETDEESVHDFLKPLTCLEVLDLNDTDIGDRGALALAPILLDIQTLQRLYLWDSWITEEGSRALLDSVRLNYSLTALGGLALTDSQKYELQFYLDRNKGPAHLVEATVPLALWPHALSQAACYGNELVDSLDEGETDDSASESDESDEDEDDDDDDEDDDEEAEVLRKGPDMLYFLVRESCDEIFRNVATQNGSRRKKRKRSGYHGRRTKRRGG